MKTRRPERNRRERKARYIWAKNKMTRYPECAYNGDFYCDHIYDPAYPWQWIDFRFFHSRVKRYYAVAMITTWFDAYNKFEDECFDEAERLYAGDWSAQAGYVNGLKNAPPDKSYSITPYIQLKDYGRVAIGLYATVNTPHIDEHYIRKFIADFKAHGEPTSPGWSWYGEKTEVNLRRAAGTEAS